MRYKIYCDMDGVLTNFRKEAHKFFPGISRKSSKQDQQEFWNRVMEYGLQRFWGEMEWMSDGKKLWNYIDKYDPYILSAIKVPPKTKRIGESPGAQGKKIWIIKNIGWQQIPYTYIVLRSQKKKYADAASILIDDDEKNISEWKSAGGVGILHKSTSKTIEEIKKYEDS